MALRAALLAACLAAPSAEAHPRGLRSQRRLAGSDLQHMWGTCDPDGKQANGCALAGGDKCSDHLSSGPDDADVELRLGGLLPSDSNGTVHLQWWAARRSPTDYDLLDTLVNCSIYADYKDAYPAYSDVDFNGGNVRVSEAGEAVIRIRAPATYWVWQCIRLPHIHLRYCKGDSFAMYTCDTVNFGVQEAWVSKGRQESNIKILSIEPFRHDIATTPVNPSAPQPRDYIASVRRNPEPTSTTLSAADVETSTTTATETATTEGAAAVELQSSLNEMISTAKDALDLDALEFSPVYQCLLDNKVYDHFSSECAESCGDDTDVSQGQCVREETDDEPAEIQATWKLYIECDSDACWHDKKNKTLHDVRLSLASHLDIPFQEIEVSWGFKEATARRLSDAELVTAYLQVTVASNRVSEDEAAQLLGSFLPDKDFAAELLGLDVRSLEKASTPVDVGALNDPETMGQGKDPYEPAYEELAKGAGTGSAAPPSNSALGFLPPGAIVGIAIAVVALGALAGLLLWRQRRRARAQQQGNNGSKAAEAKGVDPIEDAEKAPQGSAAEPSPAEDGAKL